MRQHQYGDLSNLNAPYDVVPLQGVGQPFQNPDDPKYPWKQKSQQTVQLQQDINEGLTSAGKCLIVEDGFLGYKTCGALAYFGKDGEVQTCLNHSDVEPYEMPTDPPCALLSPVVPRAPDTGTEENGVQVRRPMNMGVWMGVGLGALAIVAAMMLRKKKR